MTDNSLHRYYTNAQDSSSIGKFRIVDIMENSKGEIYFGTIGSGLFKYIPDNDSFCQYGLGNNALPSDYCYYICESPIYRHLLILHSKGFSLFDPETGKSKHTYNLFQMGYCQGSSIYFAQNGETFIGGVNGMLSFSKNNSTTATIIIISILISCGCITHAYCPMMKPESSRKHSRK